MSCTEAEGEGISTDKVKELLHQATDVVYGSEDQGPESIKSSILSSCDHFVTMASSLEKGEYDYDGTPQEENVCHTFRLVIQLSRMVNACVASPPYMNYGSVQYTSILYSSLFVVCTNP